MNLFNIFFECTNPFTQGCVYICIGILTIIVLYGGIYLPLVKKEKRDLDVTHPQLIYTASALIFALIVLYADILLFKKAVFFSLIFAFWSVYSVRAVFIVMSISLGYMMSMHFFPKNFIGTILFLIFNIGVVLI